MEIERAEAGHRPARPLVARVVGQAGIADPRHRRVAAPAARPASGRSAGPGPGGRAGCAARGATGRPPSGPGSPRTHAAPPPAPPRVAVSSDRVTTAPSSTSECPDSILVIECTTTSAPRSSGRCSRGVAKVLSTTSRIRPRQLRADPGQVGDLHHRVGGRLQPHQVGAVRGGEHRLGVGHVHPADRPAVAGAPGRRRPRPPRGSSRRAGPPPHRARPARGPPGWPPCRRRRSAPHRLPGRRPPPPGPSRSGCRPGRSPPSRRCPGRRRRSTRSAPPG